MEYKNRVLRHNAAVVALIAAFIMVGCDKGGAQKTAGQSLARVNGYELTVHQLNSELASAPQASANDPAHRREAMDSLINRRLLVAEAERAELDRDPEVMQMIERQKERILAQALLERKAAMLAKPTASEVQAYYQANPALFANRKVYDMRQIVVPAGAATPALREYVDSGKPIDDVIVWLDKTNVPYSSGSGSRSTADLPQQIVAHLDTIGSGKPFVINDPDRITIASLRLLRDTPVTEETARPQIERYLMNRKMRELAKAEVSRLRTAARIEYLDQSLARAPTDSKKSSAANTVQDAPKPDDGLSKGVSGVH